MILTQRVHPFPFRTRKLSFAVAKILAWRRAGKIVHRQHSLKWDIWLLRMSHFSVFRAKALRSPAQPCPAPHRAGGTRNLFSNAQPSRETFSLTSFACLLMLNTELRSHIHSLRSVASLCSTPSFGGTQNLPPYAHLLSFGGTRNLPPYAHTELGRHTKHASLCSTLSLGDIFTPFGCLLMLIH